MYRDRLGEETTEKRSVDDVATTGDETRRLRPSISLRPLLGAFSTFTFSRYTSKIGHATRFLFRIRIAEINSASPMG